MPYEIQWHKAPRIMVNRFYGDVTLAEIAQANHETIEKLNAGQAPVHIIVLVDQVTSAPLQVKTLVENTSFLKDPRLGWFVQVSTNNIWNFLTNIVSQIAFKRLRTVTTLEEALHTLQRLDQTLSENV